jgi:hypothetical protein
MEEKVLEMFRREIKDQCELALMAREDLEKALSEFAEASKKGLTKPEQRPYVLRIWQFIHAFLVVAANISKLLDPAYPRRPQGYPKKEWKTKGPELWEAMNERGIELRKLFSVDQNSPLIKKPESKAPRDYLEHFDAFLQEWIEKTKDLEHVEYVHRSMGSLRKVMEMESRPHLENFLQYFDHEQYTLVFRGDKYPLKPVIDAIEKLLKE